MSKKKDVSINNTINIKLDGEKLKKKKRKRKGKNKKKSTQYTNAQQYPTGPIIQTAPSYQQPQIIRPELDYNNFSKNYLRIKDKEEDDDKTIIKKPKLIKNESKADLKPKLIKNKSFLNSTESLKESLKESVKKRTGRLKQADILDYENLMNKKKYTIKKLKELIKDYGAPEEELKKFTKENQRETAVKLFLSKLSPSPYRENIEIINPKTSKKTVIGKSPDLETIYEGNVEPKIASQIPTNFKNPLLTRSKREDNLEKQLPAFREEQLRGFPIDQTATTETGIIDEPIFSVSPTYQPKVINSQFQDMTAFSPTIKPNRYDKGALLSSIEQDEPDEYDPYAFLKEDETRASIRTPLKITQTPLKEKTFTKYIRASSPIPFVPLNPKPPTQPPLLQQPRGRGRPKKEPSNNV